MPQYKGKLPYKFANSSFEVIFFVFPTVKVKWGRELFPDIEVNTDEEPILFKAQLFALTGVQPERQKVMCKGGILKDDEWNLQVKEVCRGRRRSKRFAVRISAFIFLRFPFLGSHNPVVGHQRTSARKASGTSKVHRRYERSGNGHSGKRLNWIIFFRK